MHTERGERAEAGKRLGQLDAAFGDRQEKLLSALACLTTARLTDERTARQMVARARVGWPVPPWLEQRLALAEPEPAGDTPARGQTPTGQGRSTPGSDPDRPGVRRPGRSTRRPTPGSRPAPGLHPAGPLRPARPGWNLS